MRRVRQASTALAAALALLLPAQLVAVADSPAGGPAGVPAGVPAGSAALAAVNVTGGGVQLRPCDVAVGALCGSIRRAWDPTGREEGMVRVGFAFVPARNTALRPLGTLVPHEGGPGYSTTGSAGSYVHMYGPLLDRRNLLLVDQRGTGRSEPIDCPELQDLKGPYAPAAGRCGRSLGARSDNYTSAQSADDLAAVIRVLRLGRVDLYGDSYGTFFAQVFAGRHPGLLRSVALDSAYPTYGETAWYPTQGPAMRTAFSLACARSTACAAAGRTPMQLLQAVLEQVRRKPYTGVSHDAEGTRMRVVVDAPALVSVAFGATYGPAFYRELPAALRSALLGDTAALLRLVAEATGGSTDAGDPADYSEGLDAAVACHDYPQLYDMSAPPERRQAQLAATIRRQERLRPGVYGPFTVTEYLDSDWQMQDWCTRWPAAAPNNPARPPRPPGGRYAATPTLVLSGEFDSITTPAEGAMVARQFPNARQVVVRNSFHVTALGDTDGCAVTVLRTFVRRPGARLDGEVLACTRAVPPIRALGTFPPTTSQVPPARNLPGSHAGLPARRDAATAAATVADVMDRWWNNYTRSGVGLYGGTFSYSGGRVTTFDLRDVRFTRDLPVSGTVVWDRNRNALRADLVLSGNRAGVLHGSWATRQRGAVAVLSGRLRGEPVRLAVAAP